MHTRVAGVVTRPRDHSSCRLATFSFLGILFVAFTCSAQDAPRYVEYDPSADHDALLSDGRPAVTLYEIEFMLDGAAAPFQVAAIGKPWPGTDGKVLHDLSTTPVSWPIAGATYEVYVSAVDGPNFTSPAVTLTSHSRPRP